MALNPAEAGVNQGKYGMADLAVVSKQVEVPLLLKHCITSPPSRAS